MSTSTPVKRRGRPPKPQRKPVLSKDDQRELSAFVNRLKEARENSGMGSRELSAAAGLSTGTVSAIENERVGRVEVRTTGRLAEALGVSWSWLVTGEVPPEFSSQMERLAESLGVSVPVSDNIPRTAALWEAVFGPLAQKLGVSPQWLRTGDGLRLSEPPERATKPTQNHSVV